MSSAALGAIAMLVLVVSVDVWVYVDASGRSNDGRPVVVRLGLLEVATPIAWLVGCLFLWFLFVPLYLVGRVR